MCLFFTMPGQEVRGFQAHMLERGVSLGHGRNRSSVRCRDGRACVPTIYVPRWLQHPDIWIVKQCRILPFHVSCGTCPYGELFVAGFDQWQARISEAYLHFQASEISTCTMTVVSSQLVIMSLCSWGHNIVELQDLKHHLCILIVLTLSFDQRLLGVWWKMGNNSWEFCQTKPVVDAVVQVCLFFESEGHFFSALQSLHGGRAMTFLLKDFWVCSLQASLQSVCEVSLVQSYDLYLPESALCV